MRLILDGYPCKLIFERRSSGTAGVCLLT